MRRALVAAFAAVAIAFTIGLAAAHTFDSQIRSAAADLTGNASPSISLVSSMRSALRQLQVVVSEHLAACEAGRCGPPPARIRELLSELRTTWEAYRLLPYFPGETELWPPVDADLDRLWEGITVALHAAADGTAPAGDVRDERSGEGLPSMFDRLDGGLARIVDWDHDHELTVAARIDRLARLSTVASVAVDLVVIALTVLAAALALRLMRRYERELGDRADDLEHFAARVAHDVKGPLAATSAASGPFTSWATRAAKCSRSSARSPSSRS